MALYHKHRPQLFSSIIDQETIVTTLQNQLKLDKINHAYLFSGPRGIGKTTTARVLAKALNCAKRGIGEEEPCDQCVSCKEITAGHSIDVIEIDAASHTGVDNVRENIISNAEFKPTRSKYKVFIIDEVHMLSTAAFNALLKTLEEPPAYVIFILATTETQKVPATIVSRCQRFVFKKVPVKTLAKYLATVAKTEGRSVDEPVLERIAKKSEGCVRDAIGLLDQLFALGEKHVTLEEASLILPMTNLDDEFRYLKALLSGNVADGLRILDELSSTGVFFPQFGKDLIELLRMGLISKVDLDLANQELDLPQELMRDFTDILSKISPERLVNLVDKTQNRVLQIPSMTISQLPLELLLVEWSTKCKIIDTTNNDIYTPDEKKDIKKTTTAPSSFATPTSEEPQKRTLTEKVKDLVHSRQLALDEVKKIWPKFLETLETHSPSLLFLLRMAGIAAVDHTTITVNVAHSFHEEKLNDKTCKRILEERLGELIGCKVKLEFVLTEKDFAKSEEKNQDLRELAAALGGEVIH